MRIVDLEHRIGLDRATIRYYEKEGLISPVRQENGYRDYSEEDKQSLLKIKLLRQLGVPLEKIKSIQQGSADFQEAILMQIQILQQNKDGLQRSTQVCKLIHSDGASYQTMEVEYYLKQLASIPLQYRQTAPAPEYKYNYSEPIKREYHPILRLIARGIDLFLTVLFLAFIQIVVLNRGVHTIVIAPFSFLSMLILVPVEAVCTWLFGTTLGKWLMGIRVMGCNGCKLALDQAFTRAWQVFRYGCGFGFPVWSLWCLYKNYRQYQEEEMGWDEETEINYQKWSFKNVNTLIVSLLIMIGMIVTCVYAIKLPRNRNSLMNVEEFVENYNEFWEIEGNNTEYNLNPNGTLNDLYSGMEGGTAVIHLGERSRDIRYDFEEEQVVGFRYQEVWKNPIMADILPEEGRIAVMTLMSSQKGQNLDKLRECSNYLQAKVSEAALADETEIVLTYENIQITWMVEKCGNLSVGENNQNKLWFNTDSDENATLIITVEARLEQPVQQGT